MNTRNEIKLTFINSNIRAYEEKVRCTVTFTVKMPKLFEKIAEILVDKKVIPPMPRSARGTAILAPGDSYDMQVGYKIAMAKAEIVAYDKVYNWCLHIRNILTADLCPIISKFGNKYWDVTTHDLKYLQQYLEK